ncbi:hypothetical protein ACVISU_007641 [Bradyrhizobium sp. USDA 4452]
MKQLTLRTSSRLAAILLLSIPLAGCLTSDDGGSSTTFTDDRGVANQPFPDRYRDQILAFMRTYLNNPVGVREGGIAEPVQRTVGGRLRYVVCLRYSAKESDGNYRPAPGARRPVRRRPTRPHPRQCRRSLRRRVLCGISGAGKDVALGVIRKV